MGWIRKYLKEIITLGLLLLVIGSLVSVLVPDELGRFIAYVVLVMLTFLLFFQREEAMRWISKYLKEIILFVVLPLVTIDVVHVLIHDGASQVEASRLVADILIATLTFLLFFQKDQITNDFRKYLTQDLLEDLAASQGRIIQHVEIAVGGGDGAIRLANSYTLSYKAEVRSVTAISSEPSVTPSLRMYPKLFQGTNDSASEEYSLWSGGTPRWTPNNNGWTLEGHISFDTFKLAAVKRAKA